MRLRSDTLEPVWVKTTGDQTTTFKEGDLIDVNGTVTAIETTDTPDGRFVTIKTEEGPRTIALAPGTYLEKNKYVLTPGDRVRVRGWHSMRPAAACSSRPSSGSATTSGACGSGQRPRALDRLTQERRA